MRPVRILLTVATFWQLGLAVVTVFPYRLWLRDEGYRRILDGGETSAVVLVDQFAAVALTYGLVLAAGAVVTGLMTWQISRVPHRKLIVWTAACAVASVATTDFVGALLYTVAITLCAARERASRKTQALGVAGS